MEDMKLVYPTKEYEEGAFEFIQEFKDYKSEINGTGGLDRYDNYDEWLLKDRLPASTFFFVRTSDNIIVGMINIRHELNDFLFNEGGHIGYSIRPTERKKGYATLMLKLGLEKCKELNIHKVLITCDKINAASAKVIQNNNGILENEIYSDTFSEIIQRYWIEV